MTILVRTIDGVDATLGGLVETTADWQTLRGKVRARSNAAFERSGEGARYTGASIPADQITLTHKIVAPYRMREGLLRRIAGQWYEPLTPAPGDAEVELVYEEDGIDKVVRVVPAAFGEHPANSGPTAEENWWYQGTWDVLDPIAYAATETESSGSPPTITVPVRGTATSRRVEYDIMPSDPKDSADGQQFRRLVTVANRSARPWTRRAVLVAPDGWSEAGNDAEAYANGRRIPLWPVGWVVLDMPAGRYWTLRSDAASGAGELEILEPLSSPPGATWYVTSETGNAWRVTDYDVEAGTWTVEDAARDTSAEALSAGDKLWWVAPQGLVDLVYGWTSAPDPNYDAHAKPIIDLASSDNNTHVYTEYYEPIVSGNISARWPRPGSPVLRALADYSREIYSGDGDQYLRYVPEDNGEPADAIGLDYNADGPIAGRPLADRWDFESPIGITGVTFRWHVYVKYGAGGGGDIKRSRLAVFFVDGEGNEILGVRRDTDDGATDTETLSPPVGMSAVSFRVEAYDRARAPDDGAALEPLSGVVWHVDNLELQFSGDDAPLVVFGSAVHDIYQIGRPDAPATIATDAGTLEILGVIVDVGDTLTIAAEDRAATPDVVRGPAAYGHLLRGPVPPIPADLDVYPDAGTADVGYVEDGNTGLTVTVRHRDAWA